MATTQTLDQWHILDTRAIWVKEFAGALAKQTNVLGWMPEISWTGYWRNQERQETNANPVLPLRYFPLQRGFAKWPLRMMLPEAGRIAQRLRAQTKNERECVLMCVSPHYAAVAEQWQGPVIYYMSDFYYAWGEDPAYINYYDRRICKRADLVCPVSARGADYLIEKARCDPAKISISAMATRADNVLLEPLPGPGTLPERIADLPRPIIGVIGNLAKNTDWLFLKQAIAGLPGYSWALVGSTEMPVPDEAHRQAREMLQSQGPRVRFVGPRPYHELADYARSFDVALLPYRKIEPTYSGSSTRFYEHLAATRPMYATDGFAELLTREPLVHLVADADDFIKRILSLAEKQFVDGIEAGRWKASQHETWEARAGQMREELLRRLSR